MTPAWAMTSHAAQGQTFNRGAIVDLKIGGSSSTMSSYVAITRVERRRELLIFRPFPIELFNQGQKPGLELLLKVWRREYIDWKAIEKELTPQKMCHRCGIVKYKECYTQTQWDKPQQRGNCEVCVSNCAKKNTHHSIALNVWSGKGKQHFHLINAVHTTRRHEYVWIV